MLAFFGGLILFFGMHSLRIASPASRQAIIDRFGAGGWKGLYSLVSLAGFVLLISGYSAAKITLGPLWTPPVWTKHLALTLMLPAMVFLVAAYVPSKLKAKLKHPMLVAIKIWALAHLLANGMVIHLVLFGAFLAWAVVDRIHIKRRGAPDPAAPAGWMGDALVVGVGVLAWVVMILWAHEWLFGVAPIS